MASIPENPDWAPDVYKIETTDAVLGGDDGKINLVTKQLADRTAFLKQGVEDAAGAASEAGDKADQALQQMVDIEAAAGSAQANAGLAQQHMEGAQAALALTVQARNEAQASAGQSSDNARLSGQAAGQASQKASEASASATAAVAAAGQAIAAKNYIQSVETDIRAAAEAVNESIAASDENARRAEEAAVGAAGDAGRAETAANQAVSLVGSVSKAVLAFPTYAIGSDAATALPDDQRVEIEVDETSGGRRTRYVVQAGSLQFSEFADDRARVDRSILSYPDYGAAQVAAASLPDEQIVDAMDERKRYKVQDGALVFVEDFGVRKSDLSDQAQGANLVAYTGTETVKGALDNVGEQIISGGAVNGETNRYVRDLEIAYNKLGSTVDASVNHRVDYTTETDDTQRLITLLKSIPSGNVIERVTVINAVYGQAVIRPVVARSHIGRGAVTYAVVAYNGNNYHRALITAAATPQFRMSYFDGVTRTVGETLTDLGFRTCRVATNASPLGVGAFPTTINNGKLIPGNPDNTYFQASCFWTAEGKLHVVPHKDELVEKVVKRWYYNHDAVQSMHFRYVLVKDGALYDLVGNGYTTETGYSGQPSGRTSIGQKANGDLVLAVIDGNTTAGTGITVKEMAQFMLSQGCINAMNLDGSGSSTMYVLGALKNSPSDGAERKIPNIIYFQ